MSDHALLGLAGVWFVLVIVGALAQLISVGVAGALLLSPLDRSGTGFALGFFLGPIGLLIAWVMRCNGLLEKEDRARRHHPIDEVMRNLLATAPPQRGTQPEEPRHFR